MRISIVPAQITTVEDKIGRISIQQAALLGIPVVFGFVIALLFPPFGQFVVYKIVIVITLFAICGSLALRIRDRIIAKWIVLFAIYCARPRYFIYDKNSSYLRNQHTDTLVAEKDETTTTVKRKITSTTSIAPGEFSRLERLALDARTGMKFEVGKKGELNVHITEAK